MGMTTETCSGALCGSTLQSSRGGAKAANADRALEEVRLRVAALRMTDHEPGGAGREEEREQPLHRRSCAEGARAMREGKRRARGEPAAKRAREDVEGPVHADHRARNGGKRCAGERERGNGAQAGAERIKAGDGEGRRGMARRKTVVAIGRADDVHAGAE